MVKTFIACCVFVVGVLGYAASGEAQQPRPVGCRGAVVVRRPFLSIYAPPGSGVNVTRGWFRYSVHVSGGK